MKKRANAKVTFRESETKRLIEDAKLEIKDASRAHNLSVKNLKIAEAKKNEVHEIYEQASKDESFFKQELNKAISLEREAKRKLDAANLKKVNLERKAKQDADSAILIERKRVNEEKRAAEAAAQKIRDEKEAKQRQKEAEEDIIRLWREASDSNHDEKLEKMTNFVRSARSHITGPYYGILPGYGKFEHVDEDIEELISKADKIITDIRLENKLAMLWKDIEDSNGDDRIQKINRFIAAAEAENGDIFMHSQNKKLSTLLKDAKKRIKDINRKIGRDEINRAKQTYLEAKEKYKDETKGGPRKTARKIKTQKVNREMSCPKGHGRFCTKTMRGPYVNDKFACIPEELGEEACTWSHEKFQEYYKGKNKKLPHRKMCRPNGTGDKCET